MHIYGTKEIIAIIIKKQKTDNKNKRETRRYNVYINKKKEIKNKVSQKLLQ